MYHAVVSLSQRKSAPRTNKTPIPSFREFPLVDTRVRKSVPKVLPCSHGRRGPPRGSRIGAYHSVVLRWRQFDITRIVGRPPLADVVVHKDVGARERAERSFRMIDQSLLRSYATRGRRQIRSRDLAPFLISHPHRTAPLSSFSR